MKKFILGTCLLLISITFCFAVDQLEKGDVYHFRSSIFNEQYSKPTFRSETLERSTWKMEVLEYSKGEYKVLLVKTIYDRYSRSKPENKGWQTTNWYCKTLQIDSAKEFIPEYGNRKIIDSVIVKFSPNRNKINIQILDTLQFYKGKNPELTENLLKIHFLETFNNFYIHVPNNLIEGDTLNSFGTTYRIKVKSNNYFVLNKISKNKASLITECKVDVISGLVAEAYNYVKYDDYIVFNGVKSGKSDENINLSTRTESINRSNRIVINTQPYSCVYRDYQRRKDTIFYETNVTIKGRIKNPNNSQPVFLRWHEKAYSGDIMREIYKDLNERNEFEIRLKIDDFLKVTLYHSKRRAEFYISPGDDIYMEFDYQQFDESITCTGIGSNKIKYSFKRYLFDKENNIYINPFNSTFNSSLPVYYDQNLRIELDTKEYKEHYTKILNKEIVFLDQWKNKISPEVYLAEYWFYTYKVAEKLNSYIDKDYIVDITENKHDIFNVATKSVRYDHNHPQNPIKVDHLIHPDNALMAFSTDYESFLYKYFYDYVYKKNKQFTGGGFFRGSNNENQYIQYYSFFNNLFTGKNAFALKYRTVCQAFKNSDWETTNILYKKFIEEYPNTKETKQLIKDYTKIIAIAPGKTVYDFELKDLNGKKVKLSSFKGKALYVVFMSKRTTGQHDLFTSQVRYLNDIYNLVKGNNVEIIYISLDYFKDTTKTWFEELQLKGIKLSAGKESHEIRKMFSFSKDHYLIFDVEGKIVYKDTPTPFEIKQNPELLFKATKPLFTKSKSEQTILMLRNLSIVLSLLIVVAVIVIIEIRRRAKQKQKLASLNAKVRELELTAIRAQMNPHFMHNCLNSIQNLVQKKQTEDAHLYISKFASFLRMVLKKSDKEEIALAEEIEMIQQYVELEQLRFSIEFSVHIDKNIEPYSVFIPPLLLQPLVENAIVHGLSGKELNKKLEIRIESKNNRIYTYIIDNGVGINGDKKHNPTSSGKGLSFTRERLELLSEKYNSDYHMEISNLNIDAPFNRGTQVEISFSEE